MQKLVRNAKAKQRHVLLLVYGPSETKAGSSAAPPTKHQLRDDVQGLRGCAIAAVLLFHFFPEHWPNGFLGVDVFFVISGYLIVSILGRSIARAGGPSLSVVRDFYFRRLRRILPLHYAYCAVAAAIFASVTTQLQIEPSQKSAVAALCFTTNIRSLLHKFDYFEQLVTEDLFTHTWSLSVEIQFYLLVPFFFTLCHLCKNASSPRMFFLAVSTCSLLLYANAPKQVAFQLIFARLWQFFSVAVLTQTENDRVRPENQQQLLAESENKADQDSSSTKDVAVANNKRIDCDCSSSTQLMLSVAFAAILLPFIPVVTLNALRSRVAVTAGAALIIAGGNKMPSWPHRLLSWSPLVWLGDISYSLYLVHWPFAVYFVQSTPADSPARLSLIPISVLIAAISYHFFECSYRNWSNTKTMIACSALLLEAVSAIALAPRINDFMHPVPFSLVDAIAENRHAFANTYSDLTLSECTYLPWKNMTHKEMESAFIEKPRGLCEMPPGEGKLSFLVIGNSYTANQGDLVYRYFRPFASSFTQFCQSSCEVLSPFSPRGYCGRQINYTDVIDHFRPDVTFVIQRFFAAKSKPSPPGQTDTILEEMKQNLEYIENRTSLIFLMDSFPFFHEQAMSRLNEMILRNASEDEINNATVRFEDDLNARPRTKLLVQNCKKCILYDVATPLLDSNNRFRSYDGASHLALFEPIGHLTRWGKNTIEPVYEELARKYGKRLRELSPKKVY